MERTASNKPHLSAEVDLWALFSFCELPQNMRQVDDTTFLAKTSRMYDLEAEDLSVKAKTYRQMPKLDFIPTDPNITGGKVKFLKVGIG